VTEELIDAQAERRAREVAHLTPTQIPRKTSTKNAAVKLKRSPTPSIALLPSALPWSMIARSGTFKARESCDQTKR
jgi:hypothetical protein